MVSAALPGLERRLPVARNVDPIAQFLENAAGDFLIYDVVFGQQNMVRRRAGAASASAWRVTIG